MPFKEQSGSAVQHPQFVEEPISKLLLNDCIQEHCEPPYCVNPLSVVEGKKLRLVIDLRHVNPCLFKHSFKYWDLHCLWPFCGKLRFFSFKVLPFGLSSACFCFTKLLRPLVKRWDL